MNDFFGIDGNVSPYVNSYNEESSIFSLLGTPRDAKACNYYQYGNSVVVESISQYLGRVFPGTRSAGAQVTMLLPKAGYTVLALYLKADFSAALVNFDIKYYTFIGGLGDLDFVEIPSAVNRIYKAIPSGAINSINTVYTIMDLVISNTEEVFRNGQLLDVGDDYTITYGATAVITLTTPLMTASDTAPAEKIRVNYSKQSL